MRLSNSRFSTAIVAALLPSSQSWLADQVSLKIGVADPKMPTLLPASIHLWQHDRDLGR